MKEQRSNYLIYGHRGASGLLPENTIEAFELALEHGADAIETDVRRTQDGSFVLAHDATGQRMCHQPRELRACTLAEVLQWDAGLGFQGTNGMRPSEGRAFRIPLLTDALARFSEVRFNIDIKDVDIDPWLPKLIETIRGAGAQERVLLTSFRSRTVRAVRRLGYEGELGVGLPAVLLLKGVPGVLLPGGGRLGSRVQIPIARGYIRFDSPSFINKCHRLGLKVDYWVVNQAQEAARLLEMGADGIMSDFPGTIRESLTKMG